MLQHRRRCRFLITSGGSRYGCLRGIRHVGYSKIAGDKGDAEYVCAEGDKRFGGLAFKLRKTWQLKSIIIS